MPEQPVVRTPRRRPSPLPRFSRYLRTRSAAAAVRLIAIALVSLRRVFLTRRRLRLIILDRRLDRVFGEHRAVDLHRRERKLLGDLRVLDLLGLLERLALHPFGEQRARGDGAAAAVGL